MQSPGRPAISRKYPGKIERLFKRDHAYSGNILASAPAYAEQRPASIPKFDPTHDCENLRRDVKCLIQFGWKPMS